jgi:hypothetical protein
LRVVTEYHGSSAKSGLLSAQDLRGLKVQLVKWLTAQPAKVFIRIMSPSGVILADHALFRQNASAVEALYHRAN